MAGETWKHGFAHTNGLRLHFVEQGQGPLMILLHGFPEFWYSWRYQIPVLAQRFHVVAPDLRGYNDSDKPEGVDQYQLPHLVEDVRGLLRFFQQEKAVLVGHDWGAIVAWAFATTHPEATTRLISCNGAHPGMFQRLQGLSHADCWPILQRLFYIFFFHAPEVPERYFSRDSYAFFDVYSQINPNRFTPEAIAEYKRAIGKPGALRGGLNYYRAILRPEVLVGEVPLLAGKVTRPTMLIWGENEHVGTLDAAKATREFVDAPFTLRLIPDCGHWVQQEAPELVNQYILEFLADLRDS
jgi:pimeloyl-ACP methyl ester carboxylesterase